MRQSYRMTAGLEVTAPARAADHAGSGIRDDAFALESCGWSSRPEECGPKIEALASLLNLGAPEAVARVSYQSKGNLLVVAGDSPERARRVAASLAAHLHVTLLERGAAPNAGAFATWSGEVTSLEGYLGEFTATISSLKAPDAAIGAQPAPAKFDLVLDFSREAL